MQLSWIFLQVLKLSFSKMWYFNTLSCFDIFARENDVTALTPILFFIIMGYLKTASRRAYNKDLKTEKSIETGPSSQKI